MTQIDIATVEQEIQYFERLIQGETSSGMSSPEARYECFMPFIRRRQRLLEALKGNQALRAGAWPEG